MPLQRTHATPQIPGFFHLPQWVWDLGALVFVGMPALVPTGLGNPVWADAPAAVTVLGVLCAVLLRSRYPKVSAGAALVFAFAGIAVDGPVIPYVLATLVCIFSVGKRTDRRWTLILALVAAAVLALASLLYLDLRWHDPRAILQTVAFVGFAAAAGDAARSRREFIVAITERARRAEETKESEARRRVAEERIKIARDLHDVLAHEIAVINLHAGVASQALPARPDDAERSLATIRQAARSVLGEIGSLLNVLRSPGPAENSAGGVGPAPSLTELDALVEGFRASGLELDVRVVGNPIVLEGASDVVAYRVLQEALTNALKHGDKHSALLHIEYLPGEIALTVTNTVDFDEIIGGSRIGREGGFGLTGIRERVDSVGGRMETASGPGPVFRLTAWLPVDPDAPALDEAAGAGGAAGAGAGAAEPADVAGPADPADPSTRHDGVDCTATPLEGPR